VKCLVEFTTQPPQQLVYWRWAYYVREFWYNSCCLLKLCWSLQESTHISQLPRQADVHLGHRLEEGTLEEAR